MPHCSCGGAAPVPSPLIHTLLPLLSSPSSLLSLIQTLSVCEASLITLLADPFSFFSSSLFSTLVRTPASLLSLVTVPFALSLSLSLSIPTADDGRQPQSKGDVRSVVRLLRRDDLLCPRQPAGRATGAPQPAGAADSTRSPPTARRLPHSHGG